MTSKTQSASGKDGKHTADPNCAAAASSTKESAASVDATAPVLFGQESLASFLSWRQAKVCYNVGALLACLFWAFRAYQIRLYSVQIYGYLIHEFDPWFNYRATEYLEQHGWTAFFHWFDYMSWYPLGRPVGTTIYPGLQITGVAIYRALQAMGSSLTLTQVCVLIPAWFGAIATLLLGAMTYEATNSVAAAAVATYFFSIVPAHTMRSMSGEFDNECIALAAMLLTFYLWMRSLRTQASWPIGVLTGLAYGYMVAAWGGYIFVLNMVALHAGMSALLDWASGTYNRGLLRAYTLFFVIGTAIATRVPPVSMAPFKSLEQLSALLVFIFLWGLEIAEHLREKAKVEKIRSRRTLRIRARVFMCIGAAMLAVAVCLAPTGYFGPLSSRVRALFVAHTRTGNPLVDSVAEHRPADSGSYVQFLNIVYPFWFFGTLLLPFFPTTNRSAMFFFLLYSLTASYFCSRMVRLILLAGPVACFVAGAMAGSLADLLFARAFWNANKITADMIEAGESDGKPLPAPGGKRGGGSRHKGAVVEPWDTPEAKAYHQRTAPIIPFHPRRFLSVAIWPTASVQIQLLALGLCLALSPVIMTFDGASFSMARGLASPRIVFRYRAPSGEAIMVRDYLDAYLWLKDNTPQDARVLSWWDYGYQITGIGNRTTLADGNTWNHEHIATLGKMLTSPIEEAHSLVRHMADYVLVWTGQGGDLMKSPHMARIGNSVYRDICPKDPLCRHFGFLDSGMDRPTPFMKRSLLYHLHESGRNGVAVDPELFEEVYTSQYGLVRIYKILNVDEESKRWLADPANRVCDHRGSWICPGQYPPAKPIQEMLAKRIDFGQIEDFNRKRKDDEYHQAYMAQQG